MRNVLPSDCKYINIALFVFYVNVLYRNSDLNLDVKSGDQLSTVKYAKHNYHQQEFDVLVFKTINYLFSHIMFSNAIKVKYTLIFNISIQRSYV